MRWTPGAVKGEEERLSTVTVMLRIFYHAGVSKTVPGIKILSQTYISNTDVNNLTEWIKHQLHTYTCEDKKSGYVLSLKVFWEIHVEVFCYCAWWWWWKLNLTIIIWDI